MSRLLRRSIALALPLALALSAALVASPAGAATDTISMTPAPSPGSPQVYGALITLSATVGSTDSSAGTVAFKYSTDGSTYQSISGCSAQTIANNGTNVVATCVTTLIPAGTVDLEAAYSGDATYSPITSTPISYSVTTHPSTLSITNATPTSPAAPGTQVTITATVGSGQTAGKVLFEYSLDGSTFVTIAGCSAQSVSGTTATCVTTGLPIGTVDLRATYQTDPNYATVTSAAFAYAVKTAATVSLAAGPASPVVAGTSVTLNATVGTGETGTVTMKSSPDGVTFTTIAACSAVAISGTSAICVTTTVPAGTLFLQADYNGNANFATATSASLSYAVTGATASTITLAAVPAGPVAFNTSVALTATLASSLQTGTVLFASSPDGASYTTIPGCAAVTISATHATCTTTALPDGTRFVRAVYSGNTSYVSATSAAVGLIVSGTTPSSVSLGAAPASPVANGTSVLLTATVGASAESGTVAFEYSADGSTYVTLSACAAQAVSGTTATCQTSALPAGTVDVVAVYSGNVTYAPSTSAALPFVVAGAGTSTVAVAPSPSTPGAPGSSVMLTATVGAGETGAVLFAYSTDGSTFSTVPSCGAVAVAGTTAVCTTTALPVGTLDVRATYLGNASFATVTSAAVPYAIQKGASTLGLAASPTGRVGFGTSVTLTATAGAGQTGTVAFEYSTNLSTFTYVPGCTSRALTGSTAACVTTALPRGTRAVVAVYSGDASWSAAASAIVALVVKPLSIKTTLGGFARNSSALSASQRAALRAFAARVAAQPFAKVVIRGWSGASLSLARARAVAAYLQTVLLADGARVSVAVAAGGSGVTGAVGVTAS